GNGVGAAEGVDGDGLDAAYVRRAAVNVAGDPDAGTAGRDVEPLRGVRAVEDDPVRAVAALDGVAAAARLPAERVGPVAAGQGIVPGAAVDRQLHLAGGEVRGVQHVVTAQHVHHQGVFRVRAEDVHKGNRTHGGVDAIAEGPDLADIVSVGAVDDDRVGLAI